MEVTRMYTMESLKEINWSYDYNHKINQSDIDKANMYVKIIENSRDEKQPKSGDIIEFTNKHGDYYKNAHIEKYDAEDDVFNICEQPYVPFIGLNKNNDGIYCSTSGGAWDNVPKNKLKYIGQRLKTFCDWGH